MRKIALVVSVVLFAAFVGNAQIKFGPKAGMNLSTLSFKSGGASLDTKISIGYHIGATFQADFGSNFFIQPSILFSSKGSKYKNLTLWEGMEVNDFKIIANYIDVPINVGYKFKTSAVNILFMAGPYFAYGVGGSIKAVGLKKDISWGSGSNNDFKPFDMGLNIGAGIEVNSFQFSMQYGFGIVNFSNTSELTNRNNVLSLSVAYLF